MAQILSGLAVAQDVKERVKKAVEELKASGITPCLATVLVGDDPASATYVNSKQKTAKELGIATRDHRLAATFKQHELLELVQLLNSDPEVHGILVQLPLPKHIDEFAIINTISPLKDVDGLTPYSAGMLQNGMALLKPCTPSGVMEIFDYYKIALEGKDVVIINRSNLVGKPLVFMLLERNATVTVCHSKSRDLAARLKQADVIITAVGNRQRFTLTADMVKQGAVVIDVATNRVNGKLAGDSDFEAVKKKASWITPVPGGVGPMTIAMLMKNTVSAASVSRGVSS
ncbi:MAG TPA: tetrahydrofolate dehydrogenase/cyclohydrolase catalytic domain-containing protein [Nitrososphaera sp.]|nr:tetrahydrofolate dehydrogenase/cyclohydrolase catalytic domain-containing protein [Nitrososphaera sp.]